MPIIAPLETSLSPAKFKQLRALILGGTSEGRRLAGRLAGESEIYAVMSLAGRTKAPLDVGLPCASAVSVASTD